MNDAWNLYCLSKYYPQTLLFNVTDTPGYLRGYVPVTKIPFLPKSVVANTVFPDSVVDFKAGPEGWVLEFQCVSAKIFGHSKVFFTGINFYSKVNSEANYQEMLAAGKARGIDFFWNQGLGLSRVNHTGCKAPPQIGAAPADVSADMAADMGNAIMAEQAAAVQANVADTTYYRIDGTTCADVSLGSTVGICPTSLVVKLGKLAAGTCASQGYAKAGAPLSQKAGPCGTLNFNTYTKATKVVVTQELAEPCCKACSVAGQVKYFSVDKTHNMCGEACMKPSQYKLYKIFEPGLTLATDNTPCADHKFHTYDSTVTHGFGPVKMTLDLYKPDTIDTK